jgi:hypothetical protein
MRENAVKKGRRYAAEGRLGIRHVDETSARARCREDCAIYRPGFENGRWFCICPAFGRCSHEYALGLVTAFEVRK